eukprot:gene23523-31876_t
MIFSQYGKISQIVARKSLKLRGQAWIVYNNINSSVAALKGKQGLSFYDKPLKIEFAKEKSYTVLKKEGITPVKRLAKRVREEVTEETEDDGTAIKEQRLT